MGGVVSSLGSFGNLSFLGPFSVCIRSSRRALLVPVITSRLAVSTQLRCVGPKPLLRRGGRVLSI